MNHTMTSYLDTTVESRTSLLDEVKNKQEQYNHERNRQRYFMRIYSCKNCTELIDLFIKEHLFNDYDIIDEEYATGVYYMIPIEKFEKITGFTMSEFYFFYKTLVNYRKYIILSEDHISITNIEDHEEYHDSKE